MIPNKLTAQMKKRHTQWFPAFDTAEMAAYSKHRKASLLEVPPSSFQIIPDNSALK
jgi:hypothetical protein